MKFVLISCIEKFNISESKSFESKFNNKLSFGLPEMITF